jgi:hypothetical protein
MCVKTKQAATHLLMACHNLHDVASAAHSRQLHTAEPHGRCPRLVSSKHAHLMNAGLTCCSESKNSSSR